MGQMITFLDNATQNSCKRAVAPIVHQSRVQFDATVIGFEGSTPVVDVDLTAGDSAFWGGQVIVQGCYDVRATLNYLEGDDCDPCTTPDTLTLIPQTVDIPANSSFPLPEGFWQDLSFTLIDSSGTPVDLVGDATESVRVYSSYTPECPDCGVQAV